MGQVAKIIHFTALIVFFMSKVVVEGIEEVDEVAIELIVPELRFTYDYLSESG